MRIPFGLDHLPRRLALDDTRLRGVTVDPAPLRLNTEPLPPDALVAVADHAARVAAAVAWLHDLCGDYAPPRRQFIIAYFDFLSAHIAEHRAQLAEALARYDGLYAPSDWFWSALRPLPRAWLPAGDRLLPADIAFWDGAQLLAFERDSRRRSALHEAGIAIIDSIDELPDSFRSFWRDQTLPMSPFRRPSVHLSRA
jgi:hypothetical protein